MKNKTLVLMSAAIITTAAVVLTAGLSLLHGSAIESLPTTEESAIPISHPSEAVVPDGNEEQQEMIEHNGQFVSDPQNYGKYIENVIYSKDIIIDIFEHATGELVGRVTVTDDEIYHSSEALFEQLFDPWAECFDSNQPDYVPVNLPEGKYRIEVNSVNAVVSYGENLGVQSLFSMAYTYGSEENIWEFNQIGYTFYGCEEYVALIDSLIADEIAKIEAGTAEVPEQSIAALVGWDDEDGYWEKVERYTQRFPYIQD